VQVSYHSLSIGRNRRRTKLTRWHRKHPTSNHTSQTHHITIRCLFLQSSRLLASANPSTRISLYRSLSKHITEHYPSASLGIYPSDSDSTIHILTVSSKYSPSNFYNGRFRSHYIYTPASNTLSGTITVDVHYYEDGNVRLLTNKKVDESTVRSDVGTAVAGVERKYQEELNRGFAGLSEGAFRGLRRQLPVTRVKVDWEKVGGYRVGQDIGGARR
jgi:capping protein alpha